MTRDEWLEQLGAGDEVIVTGYHNRVAKVDRTTKTMIIVDNEKFNRDGRRIGASGFHVPRLTIPTVALKDEIELRDLRASIESYARSNGAKLDVLRKMRDAMKAQPPSPERKR